MSKCRYSTCSNISKWKHLKDMSWEDEEESDELSEYLM